MSKTFTSNMGRVLLKISKAGNGCGFLLIIGYVLLSMVGAVLDPNFNQDHLAQEFAPLIVYAIGISAVCLVLQIMLRTDSISG